MISGLVCFVLHAKPLRNIALMATILSALVTICRERLSAASTSKGIKCLLVQLFRVAVPPLHATVFAAEDASFHTLLLLQYHRDVTVCERCQGTLEIYPRMSRIDAALFIRAV